MNILIVGANGLLGRYLMERLSVVNIVYALVKEGSILKFALNNNIHLIEADLISLDLMMLPTSIDAVIYLAQSNQFRNFPDGAMDMLDVNVYMPLKIADWARRHAVKKFIFTSSGGVYTNPNEPVKEFFDINANEKMGFYLNSKLSAEMLLKNYMDFFETFVILRPFFMYGYGQNPTMLIPRLMNNIKCDQPVILNGEEGIRLNPIYIEDATMLVEKTLELQGDYIINIAGTEIVSLKELALLLGDFIGKKPCFHIEKIVGKDLIADIDLMKKLLGVPKVNLVDGLSRLGQAQ